MRITLPGLLLVMIAGLAAGLAHGTSAQSPERVDYARDIQPLLERKCAECHKGERAKGGFDVTDRTALTQGGKRGEAAIVPGQPDASPLLRYVADQVEDLEMPPLNKRAKFAALTREEITTLRTWIAAGAK